MNNSNTLPPNNKNLKLWYQMPAKCWKEALPLGNGRIGAMVYGKTDIETVDLTEITCFSGEASLYNNQKGAAENFKKMREAMLRGDYDRANEYAEGYKGIRLNYGTNLPLGHLVIESGHNQEKCSEYIRSLLIDSALSQVSYNCGNAEIERTMFISNPHQVIALRITSSVANNLDITFSINGGNNPSRVEVDDNGDMLLYGNAFEAMHSDGSTGVAFHGRMRVIAQNGHVFAHNNSINVRGADEALVLLTVATDFTSSDYINVCRQIVDRASELSFNELLSANIKDYRNLFNRVDINLGNEPDKDIPTNIWLKSIKGGQEDPALAALLFQYGRYLLISSSRENSPLPTPLQGVWNDYVACRIGWTCDMHLDINTQMNYWPAEVTNLPECTEPLFKWIVNIIVPSGRITAKESYGLKGWVAELVSNAWGYTAPYWHIFLSPCPTSGAWIATHMWEHFLYSKDKAFLSKRAYPVIRESVEFFTDYIFHDIETGYMTSGPSISPENVFLADGKAYSSSIGCTYEITIIREIFNAFLKASEVLGVDDELVEKVKNTTKMLPPFLIGPNGELKEWSHDHKAIDPQHRHTSHLLSLYPFAQITPDKTPDLAKAAKVSILLKMTPEDNWEDTGWARSMMMLYAVRLLEGEEVYKHILSMVRTLTNDNLMVKHPPTRGAGSFDDVYELDGNTGLTACIAEALLQSNNDEIHLLPAIPSKWSSGYVKGLCARGGFTIDIVWESGRLKNALIYSKYDTACTIRYGNTTTNINFQTGCSYTFNES